MSAKPIDIVAAPVGINRDPGRRTTSAMITAASIPAEVKVKSRVRLVVDGATHTIGMVGEIEDYPETRSRKLIILWL